MSQGVLTLCMRLFCHSLVSYLHRKNLDEMAEHCVNTIVFPLDRSAKNMKYKGVTDGGGWILAVWFTALHGLVCSYQHCRETC